MRKTDIGTLRLADLISQMVIRECRGMENFDNGFDFFDIHCINLLKLCIYFFADRDTEFTLSDIYIFLLKPESEVEILFSRYANEFEITDPARVSFELFDNTKDDIKKQIVVGLCGKLQKYRNSIKKAEQYGEELGE